MTTRMDKIKCAVHHAMDRKTLTIIGYASLGMILIDAVQDKNKRLGILVVSIFGMEVLLNYMEESDKQVDYSDYHNYMENYY